MTQSRSVVMFAAHISDKLCLGGEGGREELHSSRREFSEAMW